MHSEPAKAARFLILVTLFAFLVAAAAYNRRVTHNLTEKIQENITLTDTLYCGCENHHQQ